MFYTLLMVISFLNMKLVRCSSSFALVTAKVAVGCWPMWEWTCSMWLVEICSSFFLWVSSSSLKDLA